MANIERLRKLLACNEACPEELFDMGWYELERPCGTVHCLAGNYAVAYPDELSLIPYADAAHRNASMLRVGGSTTPVKDAEELAEFFGVMKTEASDLFFSLERSQSKSLAAIRELIAKYGPSSG